MKTAGRVRRRGPGDRGMDDLSFHLGRAYCHYVTCLERLLAAHGLRGHLRPGMGPVVFALFRDSPCRLKDLVAASDLAPSTVTEVVDKLERSGVVRRAPDPRDGRAVMVCLTRAGRRLEARCVALSRELNGIMVTGLTPREQGQLVSLLGRLAGTLRGHNRSGRAARGSGREEAA